ncbi:DUF2853 family protein [Corynebacterium sp. 3HC-13]|uniref:DUF2853 family protein n=1 Tax=Corynebacterium poyangense TaxID=2684405 RepID=UPI001CCF455A|nr:DUF2853 family protein [Corynebacterium poyangense]MBZ8177320.1 DUF2853 family protein [Corynebacterium poyangense]
MSALETVRKYAPDADEAVVAAMEKTYRLALTHPDARLVSYSDDEELKTVRESFVKGKLGVTDSDESIDAAIQEVGKKISGQKPRLAVYYLLAEKYGKLGLFKS